MEIEAIFHLPRRVILTGETINEEGLFHMFVCVKEKIERSNSERYLVFRVLSEFRSFCLYVSFFFLLFINSVPARNTVLSENPNKNFTALSDQVMPVRCGVQDLKLHITQHFSYYNGRHSWNNSTLKLNYAISRNHTISYIKFSDVRRALRRAFAVWSSAIPVKFIETRHYHRFFLRRSWRWQSI
ncbi:hypothetical protein C5167_030917 [Papaver somniferum]|nr:hypothetical protein C5167_030917 [Papaver somniferum]